MKYTDISGFFYLWHRFVVKVVSLANCGNVGLSTPLVHVQLSTQSTHSDIHCASHCSSIASQYHTLLSPSLIAQLHSLCLLSSRCCVCLRVCNPGSFSSIKKKGLVYKAPPCLSLSFCTSALHGRLDTLKILHTR